jgi:hypothetical protein
MEILILISPSAVFDALGEIQIIKKNRTKSPTEKRRTRPYWKKKNKTW